MSFAFEWDVEKGKSNARKHGVSFEEASAVFYDPAGISFDDVIHSVGEARFLMIGYSDRQRLLLVVHTDRGSCIRIISARLANKQERRCYEQNS
jgi:uncharacterized protein